MYRLLVVDDEILVANAIVNNLKPETLGFKETFRAYGMDEAKELLQKHRIDIVLCDIEMPDGSGLELLEWVKCYYSQIECIMLTCHAEFDYLRQAMRLGCVDYCLKPIDYDELIHVIKNTMDKLQWQKHLPSAAEPSHKEYLDKLFKTMTAAESYQQSDSLEDQVCCYVRKHLGESILIEDIAGFVNLSPAHLMKSYRKRTGISVLQFITFERLNAAKELLARTDLSVSEIALLVGYNDYSYFIRLFKREVGRTPMNYRKEIKA